MVIYSPWKSSATFRAYVNALPVHREFLENVSKFQKLDNIPVDLPFREVSAQILFDKSSSWHHEYHQKFTKSPLERAKKKRKKDKTMTEV